MMDNILLILGMILIVISLVVVKKEQAKDIGFLEEKPEKEVFEDHLNKIENKIEELKYFNQEKSENWDETIRNTLKVTDQLNERMKECIKLLEENKCMDSMYHKNSQESDDVLNVHKMLKKGHSITEIAKKMNRGIGEVRLLSNLKKR